MIYERLKMKTLTFKDLESGYNFISDGELYLKVKNPTDQMNAVNLCTSRLFWFGGNIDVTIVNVKIVDVAK